MKSSFEKQYFDTIGKLAYDEDKEHYTLGYVDWLEEELSTVNKTLQKKYADELKIIEDKKRSEVVVIDGVEHESPTIKPIFYPTYDSIVPGILNPMFNK